MRHQPLPAHPGSERDLALLVPVGATAAEVTGTLREAAGALRLDVEDDGPGIDPERLTAGQGIGNMRDRIGAVGGELRVDRSASGGTHVTATIPVREHVRPATGR